VVVLDDTMTTGGSTLDALRCVRDEWGAEPVLALCIVDREEGAREAFRAEGIPFDALVRLSDLR
jgi:orotate phosphoribosyltransferase